MENFYSRTRNLIGSKAISTLSSSKIAVFGLGGVGSYVIEALARSGIGNFVLIDDDKISPSNLNRQILATIDVIGKHKTEVAKERILKINPVAKIDIITKFYLPEIADDFFVHDYSYIVDAIDTVKSKVDLILQAKKRNIPIISCMGTGNKIEPTLFEVADIYETSVCPLARILRKNLKKEGIPALKVIYSKENPISQKTKEKDASTPSSISFVPSVAGLIIASEVIKDIIGVENK